MTCTVNNTRYFTQKLLHKIVNNKNFPHQKEPIQLWALLNEAIGMIKSNEKQHIWRASDIFSQ